MRGAVLAAACLATTAWGCAREPSGPPDLLLVTIDTLRADRLACYGGAPDVGTRICALADGGTRFAWAFSTASQTAPSIASLLTSRYPAFHGVRQGSSSHLRLGEITLAEVLHAAGYATAAFVSNPVLNPRRRFDQGFDLYDARMPDRERNRPRTGERDAADTTDAALAWARRAPPRPWFVWVHYQDPHGPYDPPGGSPARDAPGDPVLPVLESQSGQGGIPAYQALPGLHTEAAYEQRYLDEIRQLDAHVGRLIDGLDALGPRPAVLLTADHGESFGEDGFYFAHGHSVGLDQIHVPLLWRPRTPGRSRVVQTPVSLIDVTPTLLRLAGLAPANAFQGRDLPLDGNGAGGSLRPIFAEHRDRAAVVRGHAYYARDRNPATAPPWHPARTALLDDEPVYTPADPDAPPPLESLLAGFLEQSAAQPPGARDAHVPDEVRARLRALGYED